MVTHTNCVVTTVTPVGQRSEPLKSVWLTDKVRTETCAVAGRGAERMGAYARTTVCSLLLNSNHSRALRLTRTEHMQALGKIHVPCTINSHRSMAENQRGQEQSWSKL